MEIFFLFFLISGVLMYILDLVWLRIRNQVSMTSYLLSGCMVGILFDGEAHRNEFRNCKVTMYAGHTGAAFVEVVDATGIDRYTLFDNCLFINSNQDNFAMASGFVIPAWAANNSSSIILKDCIIQGSTKLDASDRGVLYGNMDAITGADLSGVAVELIT